MRILIILCLFISLSTMAQEKFFKVFSDNGYDVGEGVCENTNGTYMICGSSSSFPTNSNQAFMTKLDTNGTRIWTKNYGGAGIEVARRILNYNDSIYFLAGYTTSFGTGDYNFYLVKTDSIGNVIWEKNYGGIGWEILEDAILGSDDMLYLVGSTSSTINFDENIYILKIDLDGNEIWSVNTGDLGQDKATAIQQFDPTTFYVIGTQYDLDSTLTKGFVMNLQSDGTQNGLINLGDNGNYRVNDLHATSSNISVVGTRITAPDDLDETSFMVSLDLLTYTESLTLQAGDFESKQVCEYGTLNKLYISSEYRNQNSAGNSQDVYYIRYLPGLYFDNAFVNVDFLNDDYINQLIATSDGGAISIGYYENETMGGTSVFVIKIGPNDDFPVVSNLSPESLVSVKELKNEFNNITIYPNPASDILQIKLDETEILQSLEIMDLNGKVLQANLFDNLNQETIFINLNANLQNGVYLLRLNFENTTYTSRIEILH